MGIVISQVLVSLDPCFYAQSIVNIALIVRRISARFQYNCAKNGKGLKIGTKEAGTT